MSHHYPTSLNIYQQNPRNYDSPVTGTMWHRICPTFAVPSDNEAFNETARHWQGRNSNRQFCTVPNGPFQITILDIDVRSEGGRAYKVVTDDGWLFDLRERVLIEILNTTGIRAGGMIPGDFCFILDGGQVLLVPVNSSFALKAQRMGEKVSIPEKDRVPFKFYSDKKEDSFWIYLGEGHYIRLASKWMQKLAQFSNKPFSHCSLDRKAPKTLYEATPPYGIDLGGDPAAALLFGVAEAVHARPEYYPEGFMEKLATLLGREGLY